MPRVCGVCGSTVRALLGPPKYPRQAPSHGRGLLGTPTHDMLGPPLLRPRLLVALQNGLHLTVRVRLLLGPVVPPPRLLPRRLPPRLRYLRRDIATRRHVQPS